MPPRARRVAEGALIGLAALVLAIQTIGGVLERVGHPAGALDDAYIHFQYARAIAEGHPFRYQPGQPISTGATSLLWPVLLAPFHALGLTGNALMWPAWGLSFVALFGLALEARALARPLAGDAAAFGAALMVLAFGGFAWGAASGMEVLPFAWAIVAGSRRAADYAEAPPEARTARARLALLAVGALGPLLRPEGSLTSLAIASVLALSPPGRAANGGRLRHLAARAGWPAALAFAAILPSVLLFLLTGSPRSSTAEVKLLAGNPYHPALPAIVANVRFFFGSILDGGPYSAEFLPKGGAPVAIAGLFAAALRGHVTKRRARAALVLLLALSMLVPCAYVTFLWNRLRYLWPFATGWLVALACLARVGGDALGWVVRRTRLPVPPRAAPWVSPSVSFALASGVVFALASHLDWVRADIAQSASGIDRQQVALGRWAREHLPPGARIGVNDTGAIAYFGDHETFDVVGLTTPTEGRYWVAGPASRVEHYERAARTGSPPLPTHFIVYPEWMATPPILGRPLHEATVLDATILGGRTMRVYEARGDLLSTGEAPWTEFARLDDALDVADLESEAEHRYELSGAREGEQVLAVAERAPGIETLDGGRGRRTVDRFVANLEGGLVVVRAAAPAPLTLAFSVDGAEIARRELASGPAFEEVAVTVPPASRGPGRQVEVRALEGRFTSFHYWFGLAEKP